jgi:hypothetical protein
MAGPEVTWDSKHPDTITVKGGGSVIATSKAVADVLAITKGARDA